MKGLVLVLTVSAVVLSVQCASTVKTCTSSFGCDKGSCCRDTLQRVVSNQAGFGGHLMLGQKGTCMVGKAQKGEVCDSACDCDTGLKCYRPMAGIPLPRTCHDEAYVIKQQAYWANCMKNPKCALPP